MRQAHFAPGSRIQNYVVVEEIARGGQGVVLRARHAHLGNTVALKLLLDKSPQGRARFLQEARTLAQFDHPGLVRIPDFGQLPDGTPFLVTQFVEGGDLEALVREEGLPTQERIVRILTGVADALEYCHQRGVIHRDIKPRNIVVERESERPRLVDFGAAKRKGAQGGDMGLTGEGEIVGTPAYMSPEQANTQSAEPVGPRSDVYSLGAVLYYLLTGRAPFEGSSTVNVIYAVLEQSPADPRKIQPSAPAELAELCLACLAKSPRDRPASAKAMARRLSRIGRQTRRQTRRGPTLWPVAVMLLGLVSAGAIVLTGRPTDDPAPDPSDSPQVATSATPSQSPDVEPSPQATETASPQATETASPQATETASPQPTETASPLADGSDAPIVPDGRRAAEEALKRADALYQKGDWEGTIAACTEVIELDPTFLDPWAKRGYANYRLRRHADAAADYTQAIRLAPDVALYHYNLGVNLIQVGDLHAAEQALVEATRLDPDHGGRYRQLGYVRWRQRDFAGAVEAYSEAIRLEPDVAKNYANRGSNYVELGNTAAARADLDRAIELDDFAFAYGRRGYLRWTEGDFAGAVEDYTQAIRLAPNDPSHHLNRGLNRGELGDYEGALEDLRRALELKPDAEVRGMIEEFRQKLAGEQGQ